jgi:hypothetical protein
MKKMGRKGGQKPTPQGEKKMTKWPNGSEIKTKNLELSLLAFVLGAGLVLSLLSDGGR